MTISEIIDICDRLVPNAYTEADKVRWLMALDSLIYKDVIATHEGWETVKAPDYSANDMNKALIVGAPYGEDIYVNYLQAKIAQNNGEDAKYNKAIVFYNEAYERFAKSYNESHCPLPKMPYFRF